MITTVCFQTLDTMKELTQNGKTYTVFTAGSGDEPNSLRSGCFFWVTIKSLLMYRFLFQGTPWWKLKISGARRECKWCNTGPLTEICVLSQHIQIHGPWDSVTASLTARSSSCLLKNKGRWIWCMWPWLEHMWHTMLDWLSYHYRPARLQLQHGVSSQRPIRLDYEAVWPANVWLVCSSQIEINWPWPWPSGRGRAGRIAAVSS